VDQRKVSLAVAFIDELCILFLNVGGIAEHDTGQVLSGMGAVNVSYEALFRELGDIPAVIDVGMGENHGCDGGGVKGEVSVSFEGLLTPSLKETTIQKNFFTVDGE